MCTLLGLPFLIKFQQLHIQGLPCFAYTLGTPPLQLKTSTFHFSRTSLFVYTFGTSLFNQISKTSYSRTSLFAYTLGTSPLQLTTSTFHFSRTSLFVYTFWTSLFNQISIQFQISNFIFKDFLVCIHFGDFPFTINNFYISFSRASLFVYTFGTSLYH